MKKSLILLVAIIVFVISIQLPDTGITGFFVKVGVTGLALAKEIMKTILTFVIKMLG